jgi:hypothetical protein
MSTDFKKVSILDDRLMTTDSLNYGVFRGGQNVTNVRMPAISATSNALNFVVPFPSESTVLDREVYLRTETNYNLNFNGAVNGGSLQGIPIYGTQIATATAVGNPIIGWQCPFVYGYNISVGSFPTQRSMDTIQVQLNNDIQSINVGDVLPALLRCSDNLCWEKNNMTASTVDSIAMPWYEVTNGINNAMGGYDLVQGNKSISNGSFNNQLIALDPVTPYINGDKTRPNPWQYTFTPAGSATPRTVPYGPDGTKFFLLKVFSTEPLVAPPFIWNKTQSNRMGIYGLQNLSVVCNYGNIQRAIKLSLQDFIFTGLTPNQNPTAGLATLIQPAGFNTMPTYELDQTIINAELQMKYLTPHGTDVKPLRNVIPLLQYPRFITSGLGRIPRPELENQAQASLLQEVVLNSVQGKILPTSATLASQTYTLNQVPDKLIIFVRPSVSQRSSLFNDYVLPITNINIQWNNHAGILANASQEQLFHMSKEAGSNQDFLEFQGICNTNYGRFSAIAGDSFLTLPVIPIYNPAATPVAGVPVTTTIAKQAYPQASAIPTIGSYLMIDVGKHLELQEPFYAPGSLGSFQLQFNITVQNYMYGSFFSASDTTGIQPEIVVIPVNSGIMVTEKGQTSSYTGILTKSDVLDSALQEPYGQMEIERIVGHGHQDKGNALPKRCHPRKKDPLNKHQNMGMDSRLM